MNDQPNEPQQELTEEHEATHVIRDIHLMVETNCCQSILGTALAEPRFRKEAANEEVKRRR